MQAIRAILGIEPFNEPNPAGLPKEQFEGEFLVDFYRNVDLEIRKFDPDVFIFMEPSVTWTIPSSNAEGGDKSILDLGGGLGSLFCLERASIWIG